MLTLYLFLHVLGECVLERGEFHVDFDDVLVREVHDFGVEELLGRNRVVEEGVEVWVDDNFLLPVLHRLLVFINVHADILNISTI